MKLLRWVGLCLTSLLLCLWLGSCTSPPSTPVVSLNFGVAGMARSALEEISGIYQQKHPNIVLHYTFAGTRVIKGAVEQGEPFDGILLADISLLEELQHKGRILPNSRKALLTTDIVAIAPTNSAVQLSGFQDLASDRINSIAIGGEGLSLGKYTREILDHLGITQVVRSKAVLAEADVREVLRAVEQGEAEVGITFFPEAKASTKVKVLATADRQTYQPIQAGIAVVATSSHAPEMQAYLDFLSSDRAQAVFQKFGLRPLTASGERL